MSARALSMLLLLLMSVLFALLVAVPAAMSIHTTFSQVSADLTAATTLSVR